VQAVHNLEIHVAHACNLACESCSHYSDHGHKGMLTLQDADAWMGAWAPRLKPRIFGLLGGEPTINPRLADFVPLTRRHWPDSNIRITTNGFFLHRHPDLPRVLKEDRDATLVVSIHHRSPEYREKFAPVVDLVRGWVAQYGIRVQLRPSDQWWTRRYQGFGAEMLPFDDGNPRASWEICPAKTCPQIHEGKVWKCGPLAYLGMQDEKYGLGDAWAPYLGYQPLSADCTDEELRAFFAREEEPACGMCSAKPRHFAIPVPFRAAAVR
jgi:hypothetical protein